MLWEEEVGRLLGALAELPEGDRQLVGLRYGSGLSTAEVAEILGVREGACGPGSGGRSGGSAEVLAP